MHQNAAMWKMVLSCLMWCLWKEINHRSFKEREWMMVELLDFSFKTFYHWTTAFVSNISNFHVFLDLFSLSS
jgi:hypothetical protein